MAATAGYIAGTQPQGYQVTPQPAQNVSPSSPQLDQASNPAQTAPVATPAATTAQPNIFDQSAQGMNIASQTAALGTQYQPMNVDAQTVAGMDLSQYTNPYETAVVQQSLDDLERARQIEQNLSDYQMGQAGAFGGSRHGIAQAEAARNYYDRAGALASNLRQQGFTQAQNLAGQDAQRMMQASLANQSAGLSAAGQRLAAAGQLSNISNLGFDMGRQLTADLMKQGTVQQMLEQNLIDAAKGQFSGYTGAPADTISYLSQALGASNVPQSQQTRRDIGLFDYLTLAASMSDARLKTKITKIGSMKNGLGVYSWEWTKEAKDKGLSNDMHTGFLAQEVKEIMPHNVVTTPSGYLAVKYNNVLQELS